MAKTTKLIQEQKKFGKRLDKGLFLWYNRHRKKREENNAMWYIMSHSGLRGIETYTNEAQAQQAADLRNALINQGWHPVKVEAA